MTQSTNRAPRSLLAFTAVLAAGLAPLLAPADTMPTQTTDPSRPTIGLVLSGGGARGAAHVGVIKVLDELRVPVDVISGTSMGAIVGGLYASGKDAAELIVVLENSDWSSLLTDRPPRADRSFRRKSDDAGFLVNFDVGLREGKLKFPQGIVQGQKLTLWLQRLVLPVVTVNDFDRLPIPFRAMATDIASGEQVVLREGDLADAMRASMSAPGIFKPVRIGERLLVDGGVANNLPVDQARAMQADVLIVVDVGFPLLPEEELSSAFALTNQMLTILINARAREQLDGLTPDDILISPQLGSLGSGEFHRSIEAMHLGEKAARQAAVALRRLSLPPEHYRAYRAQVRGRQRDVPDIDRMLVDIDTRLSPAVLDARLRDQSGQPFDVDQLEHDIASLYGLDTFETIDYSLNETDDGTLLTISGEEKRWGPNFLRFGINLEDNFKGTSIYNIAARYTRTEINPLGGEIRADLQIGETLGVALEWYQPLDAASRWFVSSRASVIRAADGVFDVGAQLARLRSDQFDVTLAAGRDFGNWGEIRASVLRGHANSDVVIGDPGLPGGSNDLGGIDLGFAIDTIDRFAIPRSGTAFSLDWLSLDDGLGSDVSADIASLTYLKPRTWGRHTLLHWWELGSVTNDAEQPLAPFRLGGLFSLSGYDRGELFGSHLGIGRILYYRRMTGNALALFDMPVYLGASIEVGNVWRDRDDARLDTLLTAGSVFAVLDTVLGPLYLAYGVGEGGHRSGYLFLGQTF